MVVGFYTGCAEDMSQILNFLVKKWHLLNFMDNFALGSLWKNIPYVVQMIFYSFAVDNDVVKVGNDKGRSSNTLLMSSWKYTGACASLKGTLRYSYFLKGNVKVVLGIEAIVKGYMMISGSEIKGRKRKNIGHHWV